MSVFEDLFLKKVNGVSDTEAVIDIGLWYMDDSEFFPVITRRTKGNVEQYFLCDFIKIWQHKISGEADE